MTASSTAKDFIKSLALTRGILVRRVPSGRQGDPFNDQADLLGAASVKQVFDVGSYDGKTAVRYHNLFPNARIHCFEPVPASFERLRSAVVGVGGIVTNPLAISDSRQAVELHLNRFSATTSRLRPSPDAGKIVGPELLDDVGTYVAQSTTIDDYCRDFDIDLIDVLKLDIQGGELAALRGADRMLSQGRIRLAYIELLVGGLYEQQPSAGELLQTFEGHGYRLYGLYNFAYAVDSSLYQMEAIMLSPGLRALG